MQASISLSASIQRPPTSSLPLLSLSHHYLPDLSVFSVSFASHLHLVQSISPGWYTIEGEEITYISQRLLRSPPCSPGLFLLFSQPSNLNRFRIKRFISPSRTPHGIESHSHAVLASCGCSFLEERSRMVLFLAADSSLPAMYRHTNSY